MSENSRQWLTPFYNLGIPVPSNSSTSERRPNGWEPKMFHTSSPDRIIKKVEPPPNVNEGSKMLHTYRPDRIIKKVEPPPNVNEGSKLQILQWQLNKLWGSFKDADTTAEMHETTTAALWATLKDIKILDSNKYWKEIKKLDTECKRTWVLPSRRGFCGDIDGVHGTAPPKRWWFWGGRHMGKKSRKGKKSKRPTRRLYR